MNRQQRRHPDAAPARPPATPEDAKRLIDEAFTDRISWVAARTLLMRVTSDPAWGVLDPDLRTSIAVFLERHPEPIKR